MKNPVRYVSNEDTMHISIEKAHAMKQTTAFILALSVVMGSPIFAQDNDRQNEQRQRLARFRQFFTLPGIEFSVEQQAKVEELRKEFIPKFIENQKQWDGVYSDKQQQARRKALQEARDAGKGIQELRDAVETAITLTEEQQEQRAAIHKERSMLQSELFTRLIALLTDEQRAQLRRPRRPQQQIPPTHPDVKYGPHERNVMDVWLAESDKPTPVLVSIHGGGFRGGNKSVAGDMLRLCLESGISVVAIKKPRKRIESISRRENKITPSISKFLKRVPKKGARILTPTGGKKPGSHSSGRHS